MKLATTFFLAVLSLGASLAQAGPAMQGISAAGPMKYIGPITPGGEDMTIEGTAEQIYHEIMRLNPKFNPDAFEDKSSTRRLQSRNKSDIKCGWPWTPADKDEVYNGVNYLSRLPGRCHVPGGPRRCARISCAYDAAIYLCNDNNFDITPSCRYLATYAGDIADRCDNGGASTCGQQFDTDRYNVIVTRDRC